MDPTAYLYSFTVCGIYQVTHVLGDGFTGHVVRAFNNLTGREVAIKMTPRVTDETAVMTSLQYEMAVYKLIPDGTPGFPSIHYSGKDANHHVLVMDLLGPSLDAIRRACRGTFTLRTICMLADQLLHRLSFLHSRGLVSCDIKPHNFAMGATDTDPRTVYMFDFGHSKMYIDHKTGGHLPFRERRHARGTIRYASVPAHYRHEVSRRDDIESLLYVLLEFYHGSLPWDSIPTSDGETELKIMADMKIDISPTSPFGSLLAQSPPEFAAYHAHCTNLEYGQRPNYALLQGLFRERMRKEGWEYDTRFDWMDGGALEKGTLLPEEYVVDIAFVEEQEWNPNYM
ncbi:kinase-like protein [Cubamyces sp. BRFM 1775]|nr:kinase-like protein [Cubamyces sp. BRFM 1775]